MTNNKEKQKVVLAALLHDIGKFWERADVKWDQSEVLKEYFPNKEFGHVVPLYTNSNSPMYGHALWTQAFMNKYNIGQHLGLDTEECYLANLAARHHKPSNHLEGIISLADKWSSSIDRPDEGEEGVNGYSQIKAKWGEGFSKKVPLSSIFDVIDVNKVKGQTENALSLKHLNVLDDHTLFSSKLVVNKEDSLKNEYKKLWDEFEVEFAALMKRCKEFDPFFVSLNDLLRKYTWCIPSATNTEPANVSLYEHLKTTAGIANSLYDYYLDKGKEINYSGARLLDNIKQEESLMMLCIDLSGIQKFIYDIANKKAAKSLKGRSFYLQLLMQSILDLTLGHENINGFATNVIYASGGKAYLILPNTDKVKSGLEAVDLQVQDMLWKDFQGKIYAVFGQISFCYETFKTTENQWTNKIQSQDISVSEYKRIGKEKDTSLDLGDLWRLVSDRAAAKKMQKFKKKILAFEEFFTPKSYEFGAEKCAVTGLRSRELMDLNKGKDSDNPVKVLPKVYDQAELGNALKRGNYLVAYYGVKGNIVSDIKIFDTLYEVKDSEEIKKLPSSKFQKATVKVFNEANIDELNGLNNIEISTLFYGGNKQPTNSEGEAKTFEDLVMKDGNKTKLAILRMDVDNLGQIFINGFDEKIQKKSFAGYATLSFMLEAFFCGYINNIQQLDEFKDNIQILYSGGDDLFAIGRWDAIIDFAAKVRSEFRRFVGRDDISISGGIAIVGAKYPIMKSAELAGDMEKEAKAFNGKTKNAINFFGETVSWEKEFDFVRGIKNSFAYFDGEVNRALMHQVQKYKLIKDNGIKSKSNDMSYIWNSAYSITRTLERLKDSQIEAISFVDSIRNNILHNEEFGSERYLDLLALGSRWAEYTLKIKNKKNGKRN